MPSIEIFDYFISYKQKDAKLFAKQLADTLSNLGADVWIDQDSIRPGDSILASIEDGIASSIDAILILSEHYFAGWSEEERRSLYSLMVSKKLRIIPIWYKLQLGDVQRLAPLFSGIASIEVSSDDETETSRVAALILNNYTVADRRKRLFELFVRAVHPHVVDLDLDMYFWLFEGDESRVIQAMEAGANVRMTDMDIWNRYNKIPTQYPDTLPAWTKLYVHLYRSGMIKD